MAQEVLGTGLFQFMAKADLSGLKAVGQAMTQMSKETGAAMSVMGKMNGQTVKITSNMQKMGGAAQTTGKSVGMMNDSLLQSTFALGTLSAAFTRVGQQVGEVGFTFNRNMTLIQAVTGATKVELEQLESTARNVGEGTEFGARKAAEGLLILSRMGLDAADSMKVLTPAMHLAQSQQHDLGQTTELVIQQLRVFGKELDESKRFSNVLAATSSKTAADLEKLGLALSYAGPVAATTGQSFEELNAVLGMMFNAGIKASRAGTGLRFALFNLMGGSKRTKDAIKAIGLSMEEVNPTTNKLSTVIERLADKLDGVTNKAEVFRDIFGVRASTAMATVVDQVIRNRGAMDELIGSISNTNEAARQYEVQMKSVSGQMLLLRSRSEELALQFSQDMAPIFRVFTNVMLSLVDAFKEMSPVVKEFIVIFGTILTAVASVGAVVAGLGFAFKTLSAVFLSVGASITNSVVKFGALTASMLNHNLVLKQAQAGLMMFDQSLIKRDLRIITVAKHMRLFTKEEAHSISVQVQAAIATNKSTASKLKAARAVVALAVAQKVSNKEEAAAIVQKIVAMRATDGVTAAITRSTGALVLFKGALKGAFNLMGGWFGVVTIAVTGIIALWTKHKAKIAEEKRVYGEMLQKSADGYEVLTGMIDRATEAEEALAKAKLSGGDAKKITELTEHREQALIGVYEAQLDLIAENPRYIKSYDLENNVLKFNNELLEENVRLNRRRLELKSIKDGKVKEGFEGLLADIDTTPEVLPEGVTEGVTKMEKLDAAIFEVNNRMVEYAEKATAAKDAMKGNNEVIDEFAKKAKKIEGVSTIGVKVRKDYDVLDAEASNRKFTKQLESLQGVADDAGKQLFILSQMKKRLAEKADDAAERVKGLKINLNGTDDAAGRAARSLESLIQRVKDFIAKMKEVNEKNFDTMFNLDSSELEKKLSKIESVTEAKIIKIQRNLEKLQDTAKSKMKSKKSDPAEVARLQVELDAAAVEAKNTIDGLREGIRAMTNDVLSDMTRLVTQFGKESPLAKTFISAADAARKLSVEMDRSSGKSYKSDLSDINSGLQEQNREIGNQIGFWEEARRQVEAFYEAANKDVVMSRIDETVAMLKLQIKLTKDLAADKTKEAEMSKIEADGAKRVEAAHWNIQKSIIAQKNAVIEATAANEKWEESDKRVIDKANELDKATIKVINDFGSLASSGVNAASDIASAFGEMDTEIRVVADSMNGMITAFTGFMSGDFASGIGGIAQIATSLITMAVSATKDAEKRKREDREITERQQLRHQKYLGGLDSSLITLTKAVRQQIDAMVSLSNTLKGNEEEQVKAWSDLAEKLGLSVDATKTFVSSLGINATEATPTNIDKKLNDMWDQYWEISKDKFEQAKAESFDSGESFAKVSDRLVAADPRYTEQMAVFVEKIASTFEDGIINYAEFAGAISNAMGTDFASAISKEVFAPIRALIPTKDSGGNFELERFNFAQLQQVFGEVVDNIRGVIDKFKDTDLGTELVSGIIDDFDTISGSVLEAAKAAAAVAGDPKILEDAFRDYGQVLAKILFEFQDELSPAQAQDIAKRLAALPTELADSLDSLASEIKEAISKFRDASSGIVDLFSRGAISYEEALDSFKKLKDAAIASGDANAVEAIERSQLDLFEAAKGKSQEIKDAFEGISDETEAFQSSLDAINEKFEDVIDNWKKLKEERADANKQFEEDSKSMVGESEERIREMEAERAAVIGSFDFTETQNQRSKRFAQARKIEKDILQEIIDTQAALNDLEDKRDTAIARIDESLNDLKNKYGDLAGAERAWAQERKDASEKFIGYLDEQTLKMKELTGQTMGFADAFRMVSAFTKDASFAAGTLGKVIGSVSDAITAKFAPEDIMAKIQKYRDIVDSYDKTDLEQKITEAVQTKSLTPASMNVKTSDELERENNVVPISNALLQGARRAAEFGASLVQQRSSAFVSGAGLSASTGVGGVSAANGFSGIVNKPTRFLAGENGAEAVNVTPIADLGKRANALPGGTTTNIIVQEHVDMRGAYGITSPAVAEKVYREVWAPARRRNLGRYINTRGKVIR